METQEKETKLTRIQLDYREKLIVQAKQDGLSLKEIADLFSISKARVHQILIVYAEKQIK